MRFVKKTILCGAAVAVAVLAVGCGSSDQSVAVAKTLASQFPQEAENTSAFGSDVITVNSMSCIQNGGDTSQYLCNGNITGQGLSLTVGGPAYMTNDQYQIQITATMSASGNGQFTWSLTGENELNS